MQSKSLQPTVISLPTLILFHKVMQDIGSWFPICETSENVGNKRVGQQIHVTLKPVGIILKIYILYKQ